MMLILNLLPVQGRDNLSTGTDVSQQGAYRIGRNAWQADCIQKNVEVEVVDALVEQLCEGAGWGCDPWRSWQRAAQKYGIAVHCMQR